MKAFEYAAPENEREVLELLSSQRGTTAVLAGGTDLIGLMKKMIVTPERVVSLKNVESLQSIDADSQGVRYGAMVSLEQLHDHPATLDYPALWQAVHGIASLQFQSQGTLGGELCQRPRCWYFRDGHGLLADHGRRVAEGDSRFHAIFGNAGPAKFVSPSRLAPALIALSASVRVIGPEHGDEAVMPIEDLFRTPKREHESEHVLEPNQIVAQVILPAADGRLSANYEVHHGSGQDYPLVTAAAAIMVEQGVVREARVVLGQVAPTPWISHEAAGALAGLPLNEETAAIAGDAAVSVASPLSGNEYKVQLARVAIKRALLAAAGLETGGF